VILKSTIDGHRILLLLPCRPLATTTTTILKTLTRRKTILK
jgi:hypothetical protein